MVKGVGCPVVGLRLGHSEFWQDDLAHDLGREWWLHIEFCLERPRGSTFQGLQLMAYVVDLPSEIGSFLVGGGKGLLKIG